MEHHNYSCIFQNTRQSTGTRQNLCVCPCVCVCVCVCLHDNLERNRSRDMKLEYIVVHENSSDEFDIEHHQIKVKVTIRLQKFSPFTTIQTVRSYNSTWEQTRKLVLSMYVHQDTNIQNISISTCLNDLTNS